ncbi:MAG: hypothetical protein ACKVK0_02470 [Pirellulales bacterium]
MRRRKPLLVSPTQGTTLLPLGCIAATPWVAILDHDFRTEQEN